MLALLRNKACEYQKNGGTWDLESNSFKSMNSSWLAEIAKKQPPIKETARSLSQMVDEQIFSLFHQWINENQAKQLESRTDFHLKLEKSSLSAAGNGVHLEGFVPPGTVVAFYPGIVYEPPHFKSMPNHPQIDLENPYLFIRSDDAIIDSKGFSINRTEVKPFEQFLKGKRDFDKIGTNPLAIGHMINHPPESKVPNVMSYSYNFPKKLKENPQFLSLIPNSYFQENPFWFPAEIPLMKTLLLITTKYVRNEELFLNYRYNPAAHKPEWYKAVDEEDDRNLWSGKQANKALDDREFAIEQSQNKKDIKGQNPTN